MIVARSHAGADRNFLPVGIVVLVDGRPTVARHSRLKSSMTHRIRKRRPSVSVSETKSRLQH
jgi:hypothetical protein